MKLRSVLQVRELLCGEGFVFSGFPAEMQILTELLLGPFYSALGPRRV